MIAYFDSSALVKLFIDEQGSDIATAVWDGCSLAVSSTIGLAEVPAALAAAHRGNRLTASHYGAARAAWREYADELHLVQLSRQLATQAGELAETCSLSGMDAIHLASSLTLPPSVICTWDRQLHQATQQVGLQVSPPILGDPDGSHQ